MKVKLGAFLGGAVFGIGLAIAGMTQPAKIVGFFDGSAIFGVGWGLGGYCPGPAFTSVGAGSEEALTFGLAMLVGVGAYQLFMRIRENRTGGPADQQTAAMIDG